MHRKCAAVMHFCGLGYSRPDPPLGQTSDNFVDIQNLTYEPHFYQYVKPAFNPLGLMIDVWDKTYQAGHTIEVPVHIINDTYENWNGDLSVYITSADETIHVQNLDCQLSGLEKKVYTKSLQLPKEKGEYKLVADIIYKGESVKSIRDFTLE